MRQPWNARWRVAALYLALALAGLLLVGTALAGQMPPLLAEPA